MTPVIKKGMIVSIATRIFHREETIPKISGPIIAATRLTRVLKPKNSARLSAGIILPKKPRAIAGVEPINIPVRAAILRNEI